MKINTTIVLAFTIAIFTVFFWGSAQASCKSVNGHITSHVVEELPNGEDCPSPIDLCTVGKFIGGIKGNFVFVAEDIVENPDTENPLVQFTTGVVELNTKRGDLTLRDASAVSFDTDGLFGGVETIVAGTGDLAGTTGRIRIYGVFIEGCVTCDYRGEICTPNANQ